MVNAGGGPGAKLHRLGSLWNKHFEDQNANFSWTNVSKAKHFHYIYSPEWNVFSLTFIFWFLHVKLIQSY